MIVRTNDTMTKRPSLVKLMQCRSNVPTTCQRNQTTVQSSSTTTTTMTMMTLYYFIALLSIVITGVSARGRGPGGTLIGGSDDPRRLRRARNSKVRGLQSGTGNRERGNGDHGGAGASLSMDNRPQMKTPLVEDYTPPPASSSSCSTTIYTDVAIVGAGAAGVAAAARLQAVDSNLDVKILESTNRIGGRVRSKTFGGYTVEEGANWIWQDQSNPVFTFANEYGVDYTTSDWYDWVVYDATTGLEVDPWTVVEDLDAAWLSAEADVDAWRQNGSPPALDQGMVQLLADNGYSVQSIDTLDENLKYAMEWVYSDFDMAKEDFSIHSIPSVDANQLVVDQDGGFEKVIQQYYANNVSLGTLMTNMRVSQIEYDVAVTQEDGKTYKSRVVAGPEDSCTEVYSLRTILTVSTGVINNDRIAFSPALRYDHTTHSPFEMAQFIKVFYQFDAAFWDDTEFLVAVRDLPNRGLCQQWMNLNHENFIEGSNILVCFLMTEAYEVLAGSTSNSLSATMLDSLLDPLRVIYGSDFVNPISTDYARLNEDVDFGNGAFSYWKIGGSLDDYAKFFGGFPTLTDPCDHNGCNSNNEWILHFSGTCSCLEYWELVNGAWVGGERSADFVLDSLGYDVDTSSEVCNAGL